MDETKHDAKIGAFVLETLTLGMYRNPLDSLREYIQNAFDSIRAAERERVLAVGAGRIEIHTDDKNKSVIIRDNGLGIPADAIGNRLVDVGMSEKSLETDAGFRGIGRLAGMTYCKRLIFRTQGVGEKVVSSIEFDAVELKKAMSPSERRVRLLPEVLKECSKIDITPSRENVSFFEVEMADLENQGKEFLKRSVLKDYLEQVAPLGLDTHSFAMSARFYEWLDRHEIEMPTVSIVMKNGANSYELFKPYRQITYSTIKNNDKIHVRDIKFFPEDAGPNSPFWIWYADTNCPGAFRKEEVGGFRLRKANIGIGFYERMDEIFREASESYGRLNRYFMGEVHIQSPGVIPNGLRDGFEDTEEWNAIRAQLVGFAHERSREVHALSQGRNADIEKLAGAANKLLKKTKKKEETGLASKAERDKLIKEHEKQIGKLEKAVKGNREESEKQRLNNKVLDLINSAKRLSSRNNYTSARLNASLDRKQKKVISEIIEILYEKIDKKSFAIAQKAILEKYQMTKKAK
ncbi:MAG: ATP-binding protein [Pseudodesulfovibrio sp.]|uniref:ATP-binding protein n=1 Tax=Pseudodesulfovibrio sp. TaxID=2035812 RepID=UPI003D0DA891